MFILNMHTYFSHLDLNLHSLIYGCTERFDMDLSTQKHSFRTYKFHDQNLQYMINTSYRMTDV